MTERLLVLMFEVGSFEESGGVSEQARASFCCPEGSSVNGKASRNELSVGHVLFRAR